MSVLTPTCDPERLSQLRRAIQSVLNQTYPCLEAIVVADGPRATHVDVLEEEICDSRLRVVRLSKAQGPAAARNAGAKVAQGEFLAFLDDDDEWLPQKLEVQVAIAQENPDAAFVFSDAYFIQETEVDTYLRMTKFRGSPTLEALCRNDFVLCVTAMVKRTVFDEVGGLDTSEEILGTDDADLWGRILHRSYSAAYSPLPLAVHNHNKDSYSSSIEFLQHLANLLKRRMRLFSDRPGCVTLLKGYLFKVTYVEMREHLRAGRVEETSACFRRSASIRPFPNMDYYARRFHGDAYTWLLSGQRREARLNLWFSMRLNPFYWKNYFYWVFSWLPAGVYQTARRLKKHVSGNRGSCPGHESSCKRPSADT
ncbi:MAG: glycosyltransferase [Acidobacteriota bacterium]|nr:MAG: glycosyltransferase [Acidobacteriota bacterium]